MDITQLHPVAQVAAVIMIGLAVVAGFVSLTLIDRDIRWTYTPKDEKPTEEGKKK